MPSLITWRPHFSEVTPATGLHTTGLHTTGLHTMRRLLFTHRGILSALALRIHSVQAELSLGMEEEAHTIQKMEGTSKVQKRFTRPLSQVVKAKQ